MVVRISSTKASLVDSLFPFLSRYRIAVMKNKITLDVLDYLQGIGLRSSFYLRADKPCFGKASN